MVCGSLFALQRFRIRRMKLLSRISYIRAREKIGKA